jgi:hypothetical protein
VALSVLVDPTGAPTLSVLARHCVSSASRAQRR